MPFKRLIGCIPVKKGVAVQSFLFSSHLPIGSPAIVADFLCRWGVDEIALLDIDARATGQGPNIKLVEAVSSVITVPLLYGGGVISADKARLLIRAGADKIAFNSAIYEDPAVLAEAANLLGSQSVIASIDISRSADGHYRLFNKGIPDASERSIGDHLDLVEDTCGEILFNRVDHDGQRCGYDLPFLAWARSRTKRPMIAMGGAGKPSDIADVYSIPDCAAAVANVLNHSEHSVAVFRADLLERGLAMRPERRPLYGPHTFRSQFRFAPPPEGNSGVATDPFSEVVNK